jgi:enamine deaminase RidA (YjgF/YER057c/UK114 family)
MVIQHINPDTMHKNPAFTQAITVESSAKLVFVGGQNGVDKSGKVVGKDIASQSEQAFKNVIAALEAAGATLNDVIKLSIYIVQGQSLQDASAAAQKVQAMKGTPPTVTGMFVSALANPDYLIEIEAVAAIGSGGKK